MPRTVLIGQMPNRPEDEGTTFPYRPNSSGDRLARLTGVPYDSLFQAFDMVNIYPRADQDGVWHGPSMRIEAMNMMPLLNDRRVIMCGPGVALALGVEPTRFTDPWGMFHDIRFVTGATCELAMIPHPSGLNRLYNNEEIRARAADCLQYCWETRDD